MIRGAIDELAVNKIGGWIYSPEVNLTGRTVLAFLDEACVGAGVIDVFRADLAAAGLGEGLCGFSFFVTVPTPADVRRLAIRLEGSDFMLAPPGARLAAAGAPAASGEGPPDPARLSWMRERGWISQAEFDFLRYLDRLGAYDWRSARGEEGPREAQALAGELFGLILLRAAEAEAFPLPGEGELFDLLAAARQEQPWIALTAARRARLRVHERSHRATAAGEAPAEPVEHVLGPDRLLFLHAATRIETDPDVFRAGLTGFRLRPAPG